MGGNQALKDMIRATFDGAPGFDRVVQALLRLLFILSELGHALVNVPRETLRVMGAPDAPPGQRNWADNLSVGLVVIAVLLLVLWLVSLTAVPVPLWGE